MLANPTDYILTPEVFNWRIFSFAIITTLGLQILSILPMIMVTASKERITRIERAKRAIQSGVITPKK
jgi:1,4-dihydroxy-2-naphthoate octaprenyltransferase